MTRAITAGANFGRDCDSIASLTGQIGGALYGGKSIRNDWITLVDKQNAPFLQELYSDTCVASMKDVSDRFYTAMKEAAAKEAVHYNHLLKFLIKRNKEFDFMKQEILVAVVDGQGGGIGKALVAKLKSDVPGIHIRALGTNSTATGNMLKAGAQDGATGENAIIHNVKKPILLWAFWLF